MQQQQHQFWKLQIETPQIKLFDTTKLLCHSILWIYFQYSSSIKPTSENNLYNFLWYILSCRPYINTTLSFLLHDQTIISWMPSHLSTLSTSISSSRWWTIFYFIFANSRFPKLMISSASKEHTCIFEIWSISSRYWRERYWSNHNKSHYIFFLLNNKKNKIRSSKPKNEQRWTSQFCIWEWL
jgi:hypothetical protein